LLPVNISKGPVTCAWKYTSTDNNLKIWLENQKEGDLSQDLGVDVMTVLKCILGNWDGKM